MIISTPNEAVIQLHNIARYLEQEIGNGTLAADVRACADQLDALLKPVYKEPQKNQG